MIKTREILCAKVYAVEAISDHTKSMIESLTDFIVNRFKLGKANSSGSVIRVSLVESIA